MQLNKKLYHFIKRVFDITCSIVALLLLTPLLFIVAFLIKIMLGSPIFFRQARSGKAGQTFYIFKFRTMTDATDASGQLLPDALRLTGLGRFLRSSSLDELPQLFNVLLGHMSLVGPRPLLPTYIPRYNEEQRRRLLVPQGLTGWAQIQGRNSVDWPTRLAQDVWYVEHCSFLLDIKILLKTTKKVIWREGISAKDHATMTEFMG